MESKAKLALEVDAAFVKRVEAVAKLKGMSVQNYCFLTLHEKVSHDEFYGVTKRMTLSEFADRMAELRKEVYGDKILPGDSAEDIRQAREERAIQIETAR